MYEKGCKCGGKSADSSQEISPPGTIPWLAGCLLLSVTFNTTTETNQPTAAWVNSRRWWETRKTATELLSSPPCCSQRLREGKVGYMRVTQKLKDLCRAVFLHEMFLPHHADPGTSFETLLIITTWIFQMSACFTLSQFLSSITPHSVFHAEGVINEINHNHAEIITTIIFC